MKKEVIQEKMQQCLKRHDYTGYYKLRSQLYDIEKVEMIPVKKMFDKMSKKDKKKALMACRKLPLFADLLSQTAIDLTNIIQKIEPNCSLAIMNDLGRARLYAERVVKIVDDLNDDEFSVSFGEFADKVKYEIDKIIEDESNFNIFNYECLISL